MIKCFDYITLHSTQDAVVATVLKIDHNYVLTSKSAFYPMDFEHNNKFQIVSSDHSDAPEEGVWTTLEKVNLVKGRKGNMTEFWKEANATVQKTPGGRESASFAALASLSLKTRNKPFVDEYESSSSEVQSPSHPQKIIWNSSRKIMTDTFKKVLLASKANSFQITCSLQIQEWQGVLLFLNIT